MLSARLASSREVYLPSAESRSQPVQVRVVQHKQSKTLYALKYINKAKCVKMKAVANIVQERRLLEEVRLLARRRMASADHLGNPDRPSFRRQSSIRFPG